MSQFEELTEKYRPKSFEEVIGQESAISSLESIFLRDEGIPHAFLFHGPHGCGKTTLAMILKDKLGCGDRDYDYLNTSNVRGIDTIRELDTKCRYKPISGKVKFHILDECHKLTNEAQNALLALLERPPVHAYFALCTTDPDKLLRTVRSRCIQIRLNNLTRIKIYRIVQNIAEAEVGEYPDSLLKEIARVANGSPRDAVKLLDKVIDIEDDDEALKAIGEGMLQEADAIQIYRTLMDTKMGPETKWEVVSDLLKRVEIEPEQMRIGILNYFNTVLLNSKKNNRVAEMMSLFFDTTFYSGKAGITYQLYLACQL